MNAAQQIERYVVVCRHCGQVWSPTPKSPLWWMAKQAAEKGRLDAIVVSGERCGCIRKPEKPEAPFRVFGYDDQCMEFDVPCDTFVKAAKLYLHLTREGMNIVFVDGVSEVARKEMDYRQFTTRVVG